MFLPVIIAVLLIVGTSAIHYEAMRLISTFISSSKRHERFQVLFVALGCFAAHLVEIGIYAGCYVLLNVYELGSLGGQKEEHLADYLYFSATSYSTLGIGDIFPIGAIRLISGFEALNGLFLIAWSTSFTYLAMERLWPLHSRIGGKED